jgi:hypothetical protein
MINSFAFDISFLSKDSWCFKYFYLNFLLKMLTYLYVFFFFIESLILSSMKKISTSPMASCVDHLIKYLSF